MAATLYSTSPRWSASARFTAVVETPVKINNPDRALFSAWTITTSDALPSIAPNATNLIRPRDTDRLTLFAGERLWLALADGSVHADSQISIEV